MTRIRRHWDFATYRVLPMMMYFVSRICFFIRSILTRPFLSVLDSWEMQSVTRCLARILTYSCCFFQKSKSKSTRCVLDSVWNLVRVVEIINGFLDISWRSLSPENNKVPTRQSQCLTTSTRVALPFSDQRLMKTPQFL